MFSHVIFKILLTVFNQSYNCQTSHYLGRNLLPKPLLSLPSLVNTNLQSLALSYLDLTEMTGNKGGFVNCSKITKYVRIYSKCARRTSIFCVNLNYIDNFQAFLSLQVRARDLLYISFLMNSVTCMRA